MEIELKLSVEEVQFIVNTLGELPTKSGAFPVAVKIKQQADAQLLKAENKPEE
jgi:hypothetical protein